jgi:hypothetical protein
MPLQRATPITVVEVLVVVIIVTLVALAGWLASHGPSAVIHIASEPEEVSSVVFSAILADSKGRTVPATISVSPEDVPKLAQGNAWRVLINTDDVQWNLEKP